MDEVQSQAVRCADPECDGLAEPEQDGEHLYYACTSCGFEFGYERTPQPTLSGSADGACAIGVPERLRRQLSLHEDELVPTSTPVTIGRRSGPPS